MKLLTHPHRRRPRSMPPGIRLRHGLPQQGHRLPPRPPLLDAPNQVPAAQEGIRRMQARPGRHAQALPRARAGGIPQRGVV